MHAQAEPLHKLVPVTSHWGNYLAEVAGDRLVAIHPYATDPDPTPIGQSLLNAQDEDVRVLQPMIRQGYLEQRHNSDGARRGIDPFVPVAWDTALDMAADAIQRVRQAFGNEAIYGGSYGWASAGRFHHATSQVHRFLNTAGGYTRSVNSYSVAAAEVIMTHVLGTNFYDLMMQAPTVEDITKHTRLVVCFGGIAMKNTQIMAGGLGAHTAKDQLQGLKQAGVRFVNVSPVKDDMADYLDAEWWPCRPNSDVAVMLGIAHTLVANNLQDKRFLDTYCTGFERFLPYLMGAEDGIVKDAGWAAQLAGIPAEKIGIDISSKAVELVNLRLQQTMGKLFHNRLVTARTDIPRRTDIDAPVPYRQNKHVLFGQQEGRCNGCRSAFEFRHLEVDHVIPQSGGGTDHIENLQLLCGHCNRTKGDRPQEYLVARL